MQTLLSGDLPPAGTVLAPDMALCEECPRIDTKPQDLAIEEFKRPHEILDRRGEVPAGPGPALHGAGDPRRVRRTCASTGNMPCTGCFGPTSQVRDYGGKYLSAAGLDAGRPWTRTPSRRPSTAIPDPIGTFYRYGLAGSLLRRRKMTPVTPEEPDMSEEMTTQEAWRQGSQGAQAAYARRRITIDPITRLEGHGKIDIFLDEAGDVERAYFQVPELRGFEKFAEGRPAEDMPQITSRICGVCPTAHHMAATKALDALYQVDPPPAAKKIRELVYSTFMVEDHALHFYFLGGPDFVVGPDAPAAERNILGVIGKVGEEAGKRVIAMRRRSARSSPLVGGKVIHPVLGLPGGVAKRVTAETAGGHPGDGRRRGRVRPLHPATSSARSCWRTRRTWT